MGAKEKTQFQPVQPPYSLDAERAVIGILLKRPEYFDDVDECGRGYGMRLFWNERNSRIFEVARSIYNDDRRPDFITVLGGMFHCDKEGEDANRQYLVDVTTHAPPHERFAEYMHVLVEKLGERIALNWTESARKTLKTDAPLDVRYDQIVREFEEVSEFFTSRKGGGPVSIREAVAQAASELVDQIEKGGGITGIPMGFDEIDRITNGMNPEDMIVIAARPSMGKTALAMNIAVNVARELPVHVFSLEMRAAALAKRMLAFTGQVPLQKIVTGRLHSEEDFERLNAGAGILASTNMLIDETASLTIEEIVARAKKVKKEFGTKLIVIDYLQKIKFSHGRSDVESITHISGGIKTLARELGVPIVVLSQLNRAMENRVSKKPVMADLRGSGAIEQDADLIMLLNRDEVSNPGSERKGEADLFIGKNRQGAIGEFVLHYDGQYTQFRLISEGGQ